MKLRSPLFAVLWVLGGCASEPGGPSDAVADTDGSARTDSDARTDAGTSADAALTADAVADDAPPVCVTPVTADPLLARRQSCAFAAGARAADTVGVDETARAALPIRHVVVVMQENRAFDHMLGALAATQPDADTFPPGFTNPDPHGAAVAPFHLHTTCVQFDPGHQWQAMHAQVNGGRMDGYVTSAASAVGNDGWFALGYYDAGDLPFYYFLANTYALADRYFPSVRSGTFPNRDYLMFATSGGVYSTNTTTWPEPTLTSIFDRLDAAGVSWGVFSDGEPFEGALDDPNHYWRPQHTSRPIAELVSGFAAGNLPSVVFVDAREGVSDEHPTADVQVGEAWTKRIYDAAVASPAWPSTAVLFTYDEGGGFFDHVPPPDTCVARPADSDFHELGVRVPMIAISPWARRHHVSHTVREHTSITRFIETVFGLQALTARDANSDALLDMFDFGCPPSPVPPAPPPGSGGCRGPRVYADKAAYAPGETIRFGFENGPGHPRDWIGVYPRGVTPGGLSTIWGYVGGGGHTARSGPTDGSITLVAGSENRAGGWPLARGSWVAYFLVDDGYTSIASVGFTVF